MKAGIAILISNEIDFQPKLLKREKTHFLLIKGKKIHQDDISILNNYTPKNKGTAICKRNITKN